MSLAETHARLLRAIELECGIVFDQNKLNTDALAAAMGWTSERKSTQIARALESMRRKGLLVQEKRTSWYESKRWRVVAKAEKAA